MKLKKDYINSDTEISDTLDLVPIAAVYGTGKRTGKFGSYLLASYNSDMQRFETICKIGSGFSDELLEQCYQTLKNYVTKEPDSEYCIGNYKNEDIIWLKPTCVWEVKGADL